MPFKLSFLVTDVSHSVKFLGVYYAFIQHQSVLPKGRSFTASAGTKTAVLPKADIPPQTQEARFQFY